MGDRHPWTTLPRSAGTTTVYATVPVGAIGEPKPAATSGLARLVIDTRARPERRDLDESGLVRDSKAQAEQVRSVSVERVTERIEAVPPDLMLKVNEALRLHLVM